VADHPEQDGGKSQIRQKSYPSPQPERRSIEREENKKHDDWDKDPNAPQNPAQ
jgi:hypothetical protein